MISVQHISKNFNAHQALNNISFEVKAGETLVLLGTSGSGKTTLLRLLNRLLQPSGGKIYINNEDIATKNPEVLRRSIGYVLQGYGLFPHYTVAENIGIVPSLLQWSKDKIANRVDELMQKLQLPAAQYNSAYPDTLSGGQKQRVGLARALAADPPLLLMDEPFGALDPVTKADIILAFKQLDELVKKTIIIVTHDVHEAMELADQIILLHDGNIVQAGKPSDFILHPANDFVKQFFAKQGFQSMLRAGKIVESWHLLQDTHGESQPDLQHTHTLWETLEWLLQHDRPAVIFNDLTNQYKTVDLETLRSIYQSNN